MDFREFLLRINRPNIIQLVYELLSSLYPSIYLYACYSFVDSNFRHNLALPPSLTQCRRRSTCGPNEQTLNTYHATSSSRSLKYLILSRNSAARSNSYFFAASRISPSSCTIVSLIFSWLYSS